jgi:hypothetical protein
MLPAPLRKAAYAGLAAYGLFTAIAPRIASALTVKMGLLGFENTSELEAEDWYLRAVRAAGVGMLAAGGTGLLLEDRADGGGEDLDEDFEPAVDADEGTGESEDDDSGGEPVDIDV